MRLHRGLARQPVDDIDVRAAAIAALMASRAGGVTSPS
jgi:hypothetical protein